MQRIADGCRHGRARHRRGIPARRDQEGQPQLLAQRLDDGADEQAGKQPLGHGAHGIHPVTVCRDDHILFPEK